LVMQVPGLGRRAGFSLLEVLVVATILISVVGAAFGVYDRSVENARFQQSRAAQKTLQLAIDQYRARHNRYPTSLAILTRKYLNRIPDDPTTSYPGNDWLVCGPNDNPQSIGAWRPATSPPSDGIAAVRSSTEFK